MQRRSKLNKKSRVFIPFFIIIFDDLDVRWELDEWWWSNCLFVISQASKQADKM